MRSLAKFVIGLLVRFGYLTLLIYVGGILFNQTRLTEAAIIAAAALAFLITVVHMSRGNKK